MRWQPSDSFGTRLNGEIPDRRTNGELPFAPRARAEETPPMCDKERERARERERERETENKREREGGSARGREREG